MNILRRTHLQQLRTEQEQKDQLFQMRRDDLLKRYQEMLRQSAGRNSENDDEPETERLLALPKLQQTAPIISGGMIYRCPHIGPVLLVTGAVHHHLKRRGKVPDVLYVARAVRAAFASEIEFLWRVKFDGCFRIFAGHNHIETIPLLEDHALGIELPPDVVWMQDNR